MKYYWSLNVSTGSFSYWETNYDYESFAKAMKEQYGDDPFDFGETIESTYRRYNTE